MEDITNLNDFVKYCKSVTTDENELFLLSILTATLSKEEFLQDVSKCLNIYYKWLKKAVNEEYYAYATIINNAKAAEIKHYCDLSRAVLRKSIAKDIKAIDLELNNQYLG